MMKFKTNKTYTLDDHRRHVLRQQEEKTYTLPTSRQESIFIILEGNTLAAQKALTPPTRFLVCHSHTIFFYQVQKCF
jgi:hypothetical protein